MASLEAYVLTFNCGRAQVQPTIFAQHLWDGLASSDVSPEVLVLCLQEIAPIGYSFLGGSFLTPYFNALRNAVKFASKDTSYVNLITRNVGMTGIMIFVREDAVPNLEWLQTAGIGVGMQGMGNKGAAAVRMGYRAGEDVLSFTFVSAHLAPMEEALERRNQDYEDIAKGLVFQSESDPKPIDKDEEDEDTSLIEGLPASSSSTSGMYSTSFLFVGGDLNYRTSTTKPTEEDVSKHFPTMSGDAADPQHYSLFRFKDQLTQQLQANRTLHGMSEAPITFPPTYKYREETAPLGPEGWQWASHRWPSWCDRILYLDLPSTMSPAKINVHKYTALPLLKTSDHRGVALSISIPLKAIVTPNPSEDLRDAPPFAINPDWKAKRDAARRKEIIVGVVAYLGLTWEGNGLLLASVIGILGSWLVLSSLLAT
jgi:hypothetical protein